MNETDFRNEAKAAGHALGERWSEVEDLGKRLTLQAISEVNCLSILDIATSKLFPVAARQFAASIRETSTDSPKNDHDTEGEFEKTVAHALMLGLTLLLLSRLDIALIKGSRAMSRALARAQKILASSEKRSGTSDQGEKPDGSESPKKGRKRKKTTQELVVSTEAEIRQKCRYLKHLRKLAKKEQELNNEDANMSKRKKVQGIRNPGNFALENKEFPESCDEDIAPKRHTELLTAIFEGKLERVDSDRKHQYILSKTALAYRETKEIKVPIVVEKPFPGRSEWEERSRMDLNISLQEIKVLVEVKTDVVGNRFYGDTSHLGPANTRYTWSALANILCLHAGYAIPLNRIENIVGGKPFTRSMMAGCIENFARAYLPVYKYLALDVIANASIINVDDGCTRTNETSSFLEERRQRKEILAKTRLCEDAERKPEQDPWLEIPWGKDGSLTSELDDTFNLYPDLPVEVLRFNKAKTVYHLNVEEGTLKLQTTVITCWDDSYDLTQNAAATNELISYKDMSRVVFYRSDFKASGLLLGEMMAFRREELLDVPLFVQGDMSPENKVRFSVKKSDAAKVVDDEKKMKENDPVDVIGDENKKKESELPTFPIIYAGCAAHVRRPFFRHRDDDPEFCDMMLDSLGTIATIERLVGNHQMSREEIMKARREGEKPIWQGIMYACWQHLSKWSSSTPLGAAIRYTLRHSDAIIAYIENADLDWTNNISENLVRFEALNDATSFGCDTLEGRMRLDILRTAYASALASHVDPKTYIVFIMIADPDYLEAHSENFTPAAFKKWLASEIQGGPKCPCCGAAFSEKSVPSLHSGVATCVASCALSLSKRASLIMGQKL